MRADHERRIAGMLILRAHHVERSALQLTGHFDESHSVRRNRRRAGRHVNVDGQRQE